MAKKIDDEEGSAKGVDRSRLETALACAKAGLPVVPLHGTVNGRCNCGDEKCDQPGRHPRTKHGVTDATADRGVIEKMWAKWPRAEIGIALGGPAKLLAVAIDSAAGLQNLRKLAGPNGDLPRTVRIRNHGQLILLFKPDQKDLGSGDVADGVRLLSDGDFVVAPSSLDEAAGKRRFARFVRLSPTRRTSSLRPSPSRNRSY